jgi:hypothetical protein
LNAERKATSKVNLLKLKNLSKEIAELTEDMEELKSELSNLLLYYKDEVEFKELCSKIPEYEEKRKKQEDLQNILGTRISDQTKEYLSLKDKVTPDEEVEFKLQRDILRPDIVLEAKEHLQAVYKDRFNYNQFSEAKPYISSSLDEAEREYAIKQRLEYAREQSQHYNSKHQPLKKSRERCR